MSEESAFLEKFAPNPVGDTTRIVYADWLEEHARPVDAARQRVLAYPDDDAMRLAFAAAVEDTDAALAEFVRAQVELEGAGPEILEAARGLAQNGYRHAAVNSWAGLACRERELMTPANLRAWLSLPGLEYLPIIFPVLPDEVEPNSMMYSDDGPHFGQYRTWGWSTGVGAIECFSRRGFIESVTCTAADWVKYAPDIRAAQPARKVTLTTRPNIVATLGGPDGCWYGWAAGEFPDEEFSLWGEINSAVRADGVVNNDAVCRRLLARRFPGIEFELPPTLSPISGHVDSIEDFTVPVEYLTPTPPM